MNETDLQAAFAHIRGQDAPPHGLTSDALLAAGKQAKRRRLRTITAGAVLAAALAVITPVLLGLVGSTGARPVPAASVDPTGVVSSQPTVPGRTLPALPSPAVGPGATASRSGAAWSPMTPGAGAPSPAAGTAGPSRGTGSRSAETSPPNPATGSRPPATPSPNLGSAPPSPNPA